MNRLHWPTQSIGGVPSKVRFTMNALRKAKPVRDDTGRIIGVPSLRPKPPSQRITAKQVRVTLAELLAYLDGEHNDDSVIEKARQIAA